MLKKVFSVILILFLVLAMFTQIVGAKTTIHLASPFAAGHILVEAGEKFKELLEKESGGEIEVLVQAELGSEEEVNDWCSEGKVEMQTTGGRPIEVSAPQYFFFNAPYVMRDFEHFLKVWESPLGMEARDVVAENGNMIYLGIVYRGLRQTTSNKPIYTPEDVHMLKLRLPTVKTWIAVWEEIGAAPVPIPLPDLYNSLKDGTADASEGDLPQISSFKLDEVQSYLTITNHLVQTGGILINKSFFEGLSNDQQELILKNIKQAVNWANDKIKKGETDILVDLQKKGMQVVIPDAVAFREKGKPAVEELFRTEWPVTTWEEILAY
ncbi:MAG: TRAP transporter substrate-binding protein [Atribacterota bacterium]|nr:TRAP transporter substrate-binding protein [Atribacterota bacterium]MDD5637756.1 TRAP transporter substrate-binding protein [Atribacterota bacterium]